MWHRAGRKMTSSMGSAVFDKERFLEVLLTTTMSEVKLVFERDDETRKGMNGPWHPSPSPRKQTQQQQSNRPSSSFDWGQYSFNSLNSCVAVFLSRVCENWAMAGGTLVQNDLLPLEADVFGPFDETGEVSLGSDVLACGPC